MSATRSKPPTPTVSLWYLGGNGFVVRSAETTLYIDPFFGNGDPPSFWRMIPVPMDPADATMCEGVFVTHEHLDHMHPPSYGPLVDDLVAPLYSSESAYRYPHWDGGLRIPESRKNVVERGATIEFEDLTVHVRGAHDPDSAGAVSYVIEHKAGTFFNGGDSRYTEAFDEVGSVSDVDPGVSCSEP